ncbi:MAG: hypothetical protein KDA96_14215 [Planctomycetaceae bacterium]|nr:hypothetical protein [Planctomycetaceae bacterium]
MRFASRSGQILLTVLLAGLCLSTPSAAQQRDFSGANSLGSTAPEPGIPAVPILRTGAQQAATSSVTNPVTRVASAARATDPLVQLAQETRESTRRRILDTQRNSPWQIMHALLALRHDLLLKHQGRMVKAIDWISTGPTYQNQPWFEKTQFGGRAHPYNNPKWFEGHINQTLALMSMSGLPLDHEFGVGNGQKITLRDMLRNAQMTVNTREEVTWTLWALSRYLPPDAQWKNAAGETWSIERLVKMEVDKSLEGAPCGGTHRMFVLAHARNVYLRSGKPLQGVWLEAEHKIRRHIQTARMLQNSNGTLSSNFFRGREYKPDFEKRMWSMGHVLEFLMIALPQEELSEPWVRRAIEATCRDLLANRYVEVDCSPLYHAVNALSIYLERMTPPAPQAAVLDESTRTISDPNVLSEEKSNTEVPKPNVPAENASPKTDEPGTPAASMPEQSKEEQSNVESPDATPAAETADKMVPKPGGENTGGESLSPSQSGENVPAPVIPAAETPASNGEQPSDETSSATVPPSPTPTELMPVPTAPIREAATSKSAEESPTTVPSLAPEDAETSSASAPDIQIPPAAAARKADVSAGQPPAAQPAAPVDPGDVPVLRPTPPATPKQGTESPGRQPEGQRPSRTKTMLAGNEHQSLQDRLLSPNSHASSGSIRNAVPVLSTNGIWKRTSSDRKEAAAFFPHVVIRPAVDEPLVTPTSATELK